MSFLRTNSIRISPFAVVNMTYCTDFVLQNSSTSSGNYVRFRHTRSFIFTVWTCGLMQLLRNLQISFHNYQLMKTSQKAREDYTFCDCATLAKIKVVGAISTFVMMLRESSAIARECVFEILKN